MPIGPLHATTTYVYGTHPLSDSVLRRCAAAASLYVLTNHRRRHQFAHDDGVDERHHDDGQEVEKRRDDGVVDAARRHADVSVVHGPGVVTPDLGVVEPLTLVLLAEQQQRQ